MINFSMELGRIICVTDPEEARQQDEAMKAALADGTPKPPPGPRLGDWLHQGETDGYLSRQAQITTPDSDELRLDDDVFGAGSLIIADAQLANTLEKSAIEALESLGVSVTAFNSDACSSNIPTFGHATGVYRQWFGELGVIAVLIRPDFYVYGIASTAAEFETLIAGFIEAVRDTNTSTAAATHH